MKTNRIKITAIILFVAAAVFVTFLREAPAAAGSPVVEEAAASYKTKCAMCHTPKAEKFFDPAKTDEQHVEAILKGVKPAKPPAMPGYEAKGMTADEAKALVTFMRSLRTPAN
jgi:mono/diheme cytochrome c family protein